jgi:site-specific DNA-methyltransferase (adenine-specific)
MTHWVAEQGFMSFLVSFDSESIDLIITDPPYESLEKWRKIGSTTRLKHSDRSSNDWFPVIKNEQFPYLARELYRVLKNNTHCYIFSDQESMFHLKPAFEKAGFKFWKPIVWNKVAMGMGYHYRAMYEFILFFEKGKRKLNDLSIRDILECKRIVNGYPTEKPVELLEVLVRQSSVGGGLVIDPFMGSGSTGVAALNLGRQFAGCDIQRTAVDLAKKRLIEV